MRWRQSRQSKNVEDRRGQRVRGGAKIGGGAGLLIVLVVLVLVAISSMIPFRSAMGPGPPDRYRSPRPTDPPGPWAARRARPPPSVSQPRTADSCQCRALPFGGNNCAA